MMRRQLHLGPGETVQSLKGKNKTFELHASKELWCSLNKHLGRKQRQQDVIDREIAHRKHLKEASYNMTSKWSNSIQNIQEHREKMLEEKQGLKTLSREKMFYQMKADQAEERNKYNEIVFKEMYVKGPDTRAIGAALTLSKVLKERDKQLELKQKHNEYIKKQQESFAKTIIQADIEFKKNEKEKVLKKRLKSEENGVFLKRQIEEIEQQKELEKQIEEKEMIEDNKNRQEELMQLQTMLEQKKLEAKLGARKYLDGIYKYVQEEKINIEKSEKEISEVCKYFQNTKAKMKCMAKIKIEKATEERRKRGEIFCERLAKIQAAKIIEENQRIAAMEQVKGDLAESQEEAKKLKAQKLRQETIDYLKEEEKKRELQKQNDNEIKRWDMACRFKQVEVFKKHDEEELEKKRLRKVHYCKTLMDQIASKQSSDKEVKDRNALEDLKSIDFTKDHKQFLEYAEEALQLAEKQELTKYPVLKVINDYQHKYGLKKPNKQNKICDQISNKQKTDTKNPNFLPSLKMMTENELKTCIETKKVPESCLCKIVNE